MVEPHLWKANFHLIGHGGKEGGKKLVTPRGINCPGYVNIPAIEQFEIVHLTCLSAASVASFSCCLLFNQVFRHLLDSIPCLVGHGGFFTSTPSAERFTSSAELSTS